MRLSPQIKGRDYQYHRNQNGERVFLEKCRAAGEGDDIAYQEDKADEHLDASVFYQLAEIVHNAP